MNEMLLDQTRTDRVIVPLDELGEWLGGGTPSKANAEFWNNGTIPWVSPKDMKSNHILASEDHITDVAVKHGRARLYPSGSLLLVVRSGILQHSLPVAVANVSVTVNQDIKVLVSNGCSNTDYVAWMLRGQTRKVLHDCAKAGTTVQSIDLPKLKRFRLPIPPLIEQNAIVAKIEALFSELDQGVEQLRLVAQQLKRYRQSVLKAAFEGKLTAAWRDQQKDLPSADELLQTIQTERKKRYQQQLADYQKALDQWQANPAQAKKPRKPAKPKDLPPLTPDELAELPELPKGWTWVPMQTLAATITDGDHQAPPKASRGVPFIVIGNLRNGNIDFSNTRFVPKDYYDRLDAERKPRLGDILYTVTGSWGIPCKVTTTAEFCFQRHIAVVRPLAAIVGDFIQHFLDSELARSQGRRLCTGTAQKTVPLSGLRRYAVPLPSLPEQHLVVSEIESRFSVVDELDKAVEQGLQQAEALRQSILKKAFEGGLLTEAELAAVRANPTYEPADQLLERIRAQRKQADTQEARRGPRQVRNSKGRSWVL